MSATSTLRNGNGQFHDEESILEGVYGEVSTGEMLAVMGPSGAGKSTLLDLLARRTTPSAGNVSLNGEKNFDIKPLASYVEQSDALLGVLTVKETLYFSARLSLDPSTPADVIHKRVGATLRDLGLTEVADNRIGTAIQRGVSGGQKRRVTIGASLVTLPRILFLDEPTSGLDSRTSTEVLSAIKTFAQRHGVIVIATIHQPNWETFSLFDKLLLLAHGKEVYYGPISRLDAYLADGLTHPVPVHANPSDHALDVVNTDFMADSDEALTHVTHIEQAWRDYAARNPQYHMLNARSGESALQMQPGTKYVQGFKVGLSRTWYLIQRNWINYSRNLLAYGVRLGMYLGMGILLATVWVNLPQTSAKINDRLSVHFFSVAFLGFMSVAGIPAFLEERQVFIRERLNGQYGAGPYVLANSLVTLPYLFACALLFAVLSYWSIGLHPGAGPFFRFLGILFLAVYAAESQSALIAAMVPIFVAALALASFLNGFWMCVGGYFIKAVNLPRFWYYWAHFIDFQTYAFDLLVYNDLRGLTFACETLADGSCFCDYPSSLIAQGQCALAGEDVLNWLDINGISFKLYASILLMIALVYRLLLFIVLSVKKR
ncbi:P-loop containing nucleoside triphosphate hydrolase protein [Epithele typhae]|uniref:P-loop containing nucleoside triphosphate hydrolase protein n=1 Tax=Epithele typhae TaxID=378194 RepID=UPI0020086C22|nr:P-loop containing nucleoside triphosphate hydrolase protein [Epithele typhae]KAH9935196.1 P-loop containing nucleoside triphosphate hydrolase protein [Epithele typhae]